MKRAFLWIAMATMTFYAVAVAAQDEPTTQPTSLPSEETSTDEPTDVDTDAEEADEESPAETPADMILDEVAPANVPAAEEAAPTEPTSEPAVDEAVPAEPDEEVAPAEPPVEETVPTEPTTEPTVDEVVPAEPPVEEVVPAEPTTEPPVEEVVPTEPPVEAVVPAEPPVEEPPPAPARLETVGVPQVSGRNVTLNLKVFPVGGAAEQTGRHTMVMYVVFRRDGSSAGMLQATWDSAASAYTVTIDTEHEIQPCDATSVELRHPETGATLTVMVDFSWQYGC